MPVHNADIARIFEEMADLLEISDANPFRVRAYRNAARLVGDLQLDIAGTLAKGGTLPKLPGIGADLDARIHEIVSTGHCAALDRLRQSLPPAITELLHVPGLGPKRVKALYHELDVQTLPQLYKAAREGRIRALPGFGEKTETNILQATEAHLAHPRRFKLAVAAQYADALVAYLRKTPGVRECVAAGSLRRMRETVGDIDILATAAAGSPVTARFIAYPEVKDVLASGPTRSSVVLKSGLQVDLRVVPPESYGAALHYFTGARGAQHRGAAHRAGGGAQAQRIRRVPRRAPDRRRDRGVVFAAVGLPWIAPELREDRRRDRGRAQRKLPRLVELADLRGDLHAHTKCADGHQTVREMAAAAAAHGLAYLAITDHSRRLTVARGLDPQRLARQRDEIAGAAAGLDGSRC